MEYKEENKFLHKITKKYAYIIGIILAYGLLMAVFRWGVPSKYIVWFTLFPTIILALNAIHFYIDGFIWRFSNPYYKQTVMPFIKPVQNEDVS